VLVGCGARNERFPGEGVNEECDMAGVRELR
jgi:hypothetical protein